MLSLIHISAFEPGAVMEPTAFPFRNSTRVGMTLIPSAPANCGSSSILILPTARDVYKRQILKFTQKTIKVKKRRIIMDQKFYICKHCGNIIAKVKDVGVPVVCCGKPMSEIVPGTTDAAVEKHVPVWTVENGVVHVKVEMCIRDR